MKKWIFRILGLVVLLIIAAVLYIETNKEALVAAAVDEANQSIKGTLVYGDADVSLFRSFPDLRITLHDVHLESESLETTSQLLTSRSLALDLNIKSVIQSEEPVKVNSIVISNAYLNLIAGTDGIANYNILNSSESSTSEAVDLKIDNFKIIESTIEYLDLNNGYKSKLDHINLDSKISYIAEAIDIQSEITSELLLKYGKVLPSYKVNLNIESDIHVSSDLNVVTVKDANVVLNDLPLALNGSVALSEGDMDYKFDLNSPATAFKKLISLLPNYYKNEYGSIVSKGSYTLSGSINGNTKNNYPKYNLKIDTKDGAISYPGLANQIDKIAFDIVASNQSSNSYYSNVKIRILDFRSGSSFLKGDIEIVQKAGKHQTKFDVSSDLDLNEIKESLVLTETSELSGKIKGTVKGSATIQPDNAVAISDQLFDTDLDINDLKYKTSTTSILIKEGKITGDVEALNYTLTGLNYMNAIDADIDGHINTPLKAALDSTAIITGKTEIVAGIIDLNQLASKDTSLSVGYTVPATAIDYNLSADLIKYGDYEVNKLESKGILNNEESKSSFSVAEFKGSKIEGDLTLSNLLGYTMNSDTLEGKINIKSDQLLLDEFMLEEDSTAVPSEGDLIPGNIALDINYNSDAIKFKNIDIAKSLGEVRLKDKKIVFKNEGDIFGGKVAFTGTFDTDKGEGYNLDLNLQLLGLQFGETASKLEVFSKLIPIAKFIEGKYDAALNWQSDLNKDYIPDLNSLSAYGEIETQDGSINGLLPIDTFIRRIVKVDKAEVLKIDDTKKYFLVEEGKVVVKQINLNRDDIEIGLSGSHSFSQALDYQMTIDIPKSKLKADMILDFVQDKFKFSDKLSSATSDVKVQIVAYMGGTITKPKFSIQKINLKKGSVVESIEDQVKATIKDTRDSIENVIQDTISATKEMIKNKIDSTKEDALRRIDSTKELIKSAIDSNVASLEDLIAEEKSEILKDGTSIIDSIKAGNVDSVLHRIEDLFGKNQGKIDSLLKKPPVDVSIFKGLLKKKGGS